MTRVTADLGISLDGFAAGPDQSMDHPLGVGGLHLLDDWMFDAAEENAAEVEAIVARSAFIMGRNMFGPPEGGDWDDAWRGWWGEDPPYHAPVFVLTHHERDDLPMDGGTTFHFVTDGIEAALDRAREAAGDGEVGIMGGAETTRQYLAAGLIDELRLHMVPLVLGSGERLLEDLAGLRLEPVSARHTSKVTHLTYRRA
ncbi:dihydrofolate reductase family protein [Aeromicrobium sp.]|uniref:dihydrofolate reductase family protein n=1 Tax=Aeromicrobium sp. TaxID=1871063 RepID=UPI003C563E59